MRFWAVILAIGLTSRLNAIDAIIRDVVYARHGDSALKLDIYGSEDGPNDHERLQPTIVWVHGGAWRRGSKDSVPVLPMRYRGFAIVSVEYRLSPKAMFPAQANDLHAALRFLKSNANRYGLDTQQFVIAGASAGGHLAALVGVTDDVDVLTQAHDASERTDSSVQAIVSFYGASNLQSILSQSTEHGLSVRVPALQLLLGGQPMDVPRLAKLASPVTHVDPDDPPIMLIHGDADPQMPYQQSVELNDRYRSAGLQSKLITVAGARHGGPEFYTEERMDRLAEQLLGWMRRRD